MSLKSNSKKAKQLPRRQRVDKQTAMLREWLREVLSTATAVTVTMDRVPIGWEKDFEDWPTIAEITQQA